MNLTTRIIIFVLGVSMACHSAYQLGASSVRSQMDHQEYLLQSQILDLKIQLIKLKNKQEDSPKHQE